MCNDDVLNEKVWARSRQAREQYRWCAYYCIKGFLWQQQHDKMNVSWILTNWNTKYKNWQTQLIIIIIINDNMYCITKWIVIVVNSIEGKTKARIITFGLCANYIKCILLYTNWFHFETTTQIVAIFSIPFVVIEQFPKKTKLNRRRPVGKKKENSSKNQ